MSYRHVISDLDGTLLNEAGLMTPYTCETLRRVQAAGVGVVLASGRALSSIQPFAQAIGTTLPIISSNGAVIADAQTGEPILLDCVPVPEAIEAARLLEEGGYYFQSYDTSASNRFYCEAISTGSDIYRKSTLMEPCPVGKLSEFIQKPTPKLLAIVEAEAMAGLRDRLRNHFAGRLTVTNSTPHLIEITGLGVNKGNALRSLCRHLGVSPAEFIAFGDGGNDESMLTAAGMGVAMRNAQPALLEIAARICESNEDDGVAHFLARHVLHETE